MGIKAYQSVLYLAGADYAVRVFIQTEPRVWEVWYTLRGHCKAVMSIVLHPKENLLFSGSADKSIRVWRMNAEHPELQQEKPTFLQELTGHTAEVSKVEVACDKLFSASYDGTIRVWCLESKEEPRLSCTQVLREHHGEIFTLHSSHSFLFSGGLDGVVRVWDVRHKSVNCVAQLKGSTKFVLTLTSSENFLFSAGSDKRLTVWKLGQWKHERTLRCRQEGYQCVQYHDGLLWMAGYDETLTALGPYYWWM